MINTASNNYKTLLSTSQGPVKGGETVMSKDCEAAEGGRGSCKNWKWRGDEEKVKSSRLGNGCYFFL